MFIFTGDKRIFICEIFGLALVSYLPSNLILNSGIWVHVCNVLWHLRVKGSNCCISSSFLCRTNKKYFPFFRFFSLFSIFSWTGTQWKERRNAVASVTKYQFYGRQVAIFSVVVFRQIRQMKEKCLPSMSISSRLQYISDTIELMSRIQGWRNATKKNNNKNR